MDSRVGYPSEHLAGKTQDCVASPLFATSVGLLMNAIEKQELEDLIEGTDKPFILVLDSITDPRNLGSIIRSGECAGATGILLLSLIHI